MCVLGLYRAGRYPLEPVNDVPAWSAVVHFAADMGGGESPYPLKIGAEGVKCAKYRII